MLGETEKTSLYIRLVIYFCILLLGLIKGMLPPVKQTAMNKYRLLYTFSLWYVYIYAAYFFHICVLIQVYTYIHVHSSSLFE